MGYRLPHATPGNPPLKRLKLSKALVDKLSSLNDAESVRQDCRWFTRTEGTEIMTIEQRAIIHRILSEEYIRNLDRARDYQCKGLPALALAYLSRAEKILRLLEELARA